MVKESLSKELLNSPTPQKKALINVVMIFIYTSAFQSKEINSLFSPSSIWAGNTGEPLSAYQVNIHSGEWKSPDSAGQGEL